MSSIGPGEDLDALNGSQGHMGGDGSPRVRMVMDMDMVMELATVKVWRL